jgi:hypothetical protein
MAQPRMFEGTGEELQRHLQQYPNERFRLVPIAKGTSLDGFEAQASPETITPDEEECLLDELAALGKHLTVSPSSETFSRETIYTDHD